ncbi:terpenoid synthase [Trametes meyenii]|nr:terpenoid synthase [Trametes meyenii]
MAPVAVIDNYLPNLPKPDGGVVIAPAGSACSSSSVVDAESSTNNGDVKASVSREVPLSVLQDTISEFLRSCDYTPPRTTHNNDLRRWLTEQVASWSVAVSPKFLSKTIDAGCTYVEAVFGHVPVENRRYIALYTACMLYADDLGEEDPGAVLHFTRRFVRGETQPNAVFECLAGLLRRAYDVWPQFGADSIVTGTLDALAANHIECVMRTVPVKPFASRYPYYLRQRAGIGAPFTHFMFANDWRQTPESYIQVVPEIDHWSLGANLSFYKEELAGETHNYVHIRCAADQTSPETVLRKLVEEVSDTARRVDMIVADDPELANIWTPYKKAYIEFHLRTPRYRLAELGFSPQWSTSHRLDI